MKKKYVILSLLLTLGVLATTAIVYAGGPGCIGPACG